MFSPSATCFFMGPTSFPGTATSVAAAARAAAEQIVPLGPEERPKEAGAVGFRRRRMGKDITIYGAFHKWGFHGVSIKVGL